MLIGHLYQRIFLTVLNTGNEELMKRIEKRTNWWDDFDLVSLLITGPPFCSPPTGPFKAIAAGGKKNRHSLT